MPQTAVADMLFMTVSSGTIPHEHRPGWESQLLETGFLAMFLVPWLSLARFPQRSPVSLACVWGYRWLLFRIMVKGIQAKRSL